MSTMRVKKNAVLVVCLIAGLSICLLINSLNTSSSHQEVISRPLDSVIHDSTSFFERGVPKYDPSAVLLPYVSNAPDTIHMLWCGEGKIFEFRNYLSVLSIFKMQQPNKLVIHYYPGWPLYKDNHDYNLWLSQLREEYYNIVLRAKEGDKPNCSNDSEVMEHIFDVLKGGGIYINETVILNHSIHKYRKQSITVALFDKSRPTTSSNIAFVITKEGIASHQNIQSAQKLDCLKSSKLSYVAGNYPLCVLVETNLFPKDIMTSDSLWSSLVRYIYYGSPEKVYPRWSMDDPIPNIGHMVLLGGHEMNMLTYLSIRSMIHCVGADAMYIYIDQEPKGKWYEKLKAEEPLAIFVFHEWPESVFGISIGDGSHASDLLRFDLLYRYGGIYVDWDAVVLKPLGDLRGYGFVTNFDWPDWHPPYPDVINNGVSAGKKGSSFLKKSLQLFSKYNPDGDWYYNGLLMPYKLYEQYPELVKIEKKLQVICFNLKCHPIWLPGYHNENIHHLNGANFNWKEVYAFHWTRPSPEELLDEIMLQSSSSMFAEVGRYILSCEREETISKLPNQLSKVYKASVSEPNTRK